MINKGDIIMETKKLFSIFVIALIGVLMLTTVMSTVTAVDAASKKVKVTWDANGGKIGTVKVATTTVTKDTKIGKLAKTPKKTGYVFKGWYTKKSGGTKITTAIKVKKKVTYYAQWTKAYTLTFDANNGAVTPKSKKVGNKLSYGTLPTPTRSGYTFTGWYTAKTGGTKVSTTTKMVAKNIVVYAQWKKGNSNSGTNTNPSRVLSASEKVLVGRWFMGSATGGVYETGSGSYLHASGYGLVYSFNSNGTYSCTLINNAGVSQYAQFTRGLWGESGGTIYMTNMMYQTSNDGGTTWSQWIPHWKPTETMEYRLGTDERGQYFENLEFGTIYRKG